MIQDIPTTKRYLRQECKGIRARINEDTRRKASVTICRHIANWHEFKQATTVLTYMPMRSEVDLAGLFSLYPEKKWAIPRILPGGKMLFHEYNPQKINLHSLGMLEPDPACPLISPQDIQLVLVPGLAFDRYGWRLGYGGGFYDRFLKDFIGVSAGVVYQVLILPHIPHLDHDIPVQTVVSENGIIITTDRFR